MTYDDFEAYAFGFLAVGLIFGGFELLKRLVAKRMAAKKVPLWKRPLSKNFVPPAATPAAPPPPPPKAEFPFPTREVSGETALAEFEAAKADTSAVPIIIAGGSDMVQAIADAMARRKESVATLLDKATANPDPFKKSSKPKMPAKWPEVGPFKDTGPFLVNDYARNSFKTIVTLAMIPAASAAEIPAHLKLGGWNATPEADVMVAMLRKWQRDYGAEIVAISDNAMDIRVTRKPATREEAMVLAREHHAFCETEGTRAEAAAELMQMNWWHFWWD
jgi:hypothetical protein